MFHMQMILECQRIHTFFIFILFFFCNYSCSPSTTSLVSISLMHLLRQVIIHKRANTYIDPSTTVKDFARILFVYPRFHAANST